MKRVKIIMVSSPELSFERQQLGNFIAEMSTSEIDYVPIIREDRECITKDETVRQILETDMCIILLCGSLGKDTKQLIENVFKKKEEGRDLKSIHVFFKKEQNSVSVEQAAHLAGIEQQGCIIHVFSRTRELRQLVESILQNDREKSIAVPNEQCQKSRIQELEMFQFAAENAMLDSSKSLEERFFTACEAYENAIDIAREIHYDDNNYASLLFDYAHFIDTQPEFYQKSELILKAVKYYSEALAVYQRLSISKPNDYLHAIAATLNNLANQYRFLDRPLEAEDSYRRALTVHQRLADISPADNLPEVAVSLHNLAVLLLSFGRPVEEAEALLCDALDIHQKLAESYPDIHNKFILDEANILSALADLWANHNNLEKAEQFYRNSIAICQRLAESNPNEYLPGVAKKLHNLAVVQVKCNHPNEAEDNFRKTIEIFQSFIKNSNNMNNNCSNDLARSLLCHAHVLEEIGRPYEAGADFRQALEIYQHLAETNIEYLYDVVKTLHKLGDHYRNMGCPDEALKSYHKALEIRQYLAGIDTDDKPYEVAWTVHSLAQLLHELCRYGEAEEAYLQAIEIFLSCSDSTPDRNDNNLSNAAATMNNLARLLHDVGRQEEAKNYLSQALAIYQRLSDSAPETYLSMVNIIQHNLDYYNNNFDSPQQETDVANENVDITTLSDKATRGDVVSQRTLAFRYYYGDTAVPKSWIKALYWFEKSAEQGNDEAKEFLHVNVYSYYKGVDAYMNQDYNTAINCFDKALSMSNTTDFSDSVNNYYMAIAYEARGDKNNDKNDYEKSIRYLNRALNLFVQHLGKNELDTANCYEHIGSVSFKQGRKKDALSNLYKALTIKIQILGSEHDETLELNKMIEKVSQE